MYLAASGARKEKNDENPKRTPAILNGDIPKNSLKVDVRGAPKTAAVPRNKINNPKAFVSLSSPNRSTRIIEVSDM